MTTKKSESRYLKRLSYLSIPILGLCLAACLQSKEEAINDFNTLYSPEYQLNKTHLFAHWKGDSQRDVAPLNLKIPLIYLIQALDDNGEFDTLMWALSPMKNKKIDTIHLLLSRSNGKTVPNYISRWSDSPEIKTKKQQYYMDSYNVFIHTELSTGDLFNRSEGCCRSGSELFRGSDQAGLEHYVQMNCYDVQYLKQQVKDLGGQGDSKYILNDLASKAITDITPANCLADFDTEYWISPPKVPQDQAVKLSFSGPMVGQKINFLYKNHLIDIYPQKNPTEVVENWKVYRQQVTHLLDSSVVHQN
jgi:hypothetical protein